MQNLARLKSIRIEGHDRANDVAIIAPLFLIGVEYSADDPTRAHYQTAAGKRYEYVYARNQLVSGEYVQGQPRAVLIENCKITSTRKRA